MPGERRVRRMEAAATLLLAFGFGLRSSPAVADEYHYQNFVLGERAMGMGGAYTALGTDTTAGWYNPAGLGFLEGTSFSIQTSLYGAVEDSTATSRADSGASFEHSNSGQFVTFPSTVAVVKQVGGRRHRLGLMTLTPDYDYRAVQLVARDVELNRVRFGAMSLLQDDRDSTLWAGPTYAFRAHRRFALGITVFGLMRIRDLITNLQGTYADRRIDALQLDASMLHLSLVGLIGIRAELFDGFCLGATFRSPNLRIYGRGTLAGMQLDPAGLQRPAREVDAQSKIPWRAALGVSYERHRVFAVSADVAVHGPVGPYNIYELEEADVAALQVEKKLVVNVNVGGEYYIKRLVALRAGFFTNFSAEAEQPEAVREAAYLGLGGVLGGQGTVPDLYGVSFGVAYEPGKTTLGLAVNYVFGRGTTVLGDAQAERTLGRLLFGVSGSYGF